MQKAERIKQKKSFIRALNEFVATLADQISHEDAWDIRGFIDVFQHVYTISGDTKVISKILELHLFPHFIAFAEQNGYELQLTKEQNYYPDMTFVWKENPDVKFAVDLKSTYMTSENRCNGFTLGSHGEYFKNRSSTKNIMYPYDDYLTHLIVGIIYSKTELTEHHETKIYDVEHVREIPAVAHHFIFFAEEKWKIASDKGGSGNTANIGSIHSIRDILEGNGTFARAGEHVFDDYWMNYGNLLIPWKINKEGAPSKLTCFEDFLLYRNMDLKKYNPVDGKEFSQKSLQAYETYQKENGE